jgi:hypothetical protein
VSSLKLDDHQAIEQLEANGRHNKHIDGADVRRVMRRRPATRIDPGTRFHRMRDATDATLG